MVDYSGTCAFPDCDRPIAPPPATGGRSRYCDDPAHNPATAYRARRRRSAQPAAAPAAEPDLTDPAVLRERFERDLARLESTLGQVRAVLAPGAEATAPAGPDEPTLARMAELELAAAEAAKARAAAEADLERLGAQVKQADTDQRRWLAETSARVEQMEAERDAALTQVARLESSARAGEAAERLQAERDAALARVTELESGSRAAAEAAAYVGRIEAERDTALARLAELEGTGLEQLQAERDAALARVAELEAGRQTAEDRAYAAESAWRTLDWQLEQQHTRAELAEAELRLLRGESAAAPEAGQGT
jgi:SWI/SNF-related matrix-associated actin-dependent regulator 1 of chromatin subfamily A